MKKIALLFAILPSLAFGQGLASPSVLPKLRITNPNLVDAIKIGSLTNTILIGNDNAGGPWIPAIWMGTPAVTPTYYNHILSYDSANARANVNGPSAGELTLTLNALAKITVTAAGVAIGSGVTLKLDAANVAACSACAAGTRGRICFIAGGAGVADSATICTKDGADAYAERALF